MHYFAAWTQVPVPETHYAASGGVQIAYQVFGEGPELVWVPGWVSQLDLYWGSPRSLGSFAA